MLLKRPAVKSVQLELPLVRFEAEVTIDKNGVILGEGTSPKGPAANGVTLNIEDEKN